MAYVYVLRSIKNGKRYVGSTSISPQERLKRHNSVMNKFTNRNKPFILIYREEYPTITEARARVGRKFLDEIIN